jgi:hypothetical protein
MKPAVAEAALESAQLSRLAPTKEDSTLGGSAGTHCQLGAATISRRREGRWGTERGVVWIIAGYWGGTRLLVFGGRRGSGLLVVVFIRAQCNDSSWMSDGYIDRSGSVTYYPSPLALQMQSE